MGAVAATTSAENFVNPKRGHPASQKQMNTFRAAIPLVPKLCPTFGTANPAADTFEIFRGLRSFQANCQRTTTYNTQNALACALRKAQPINPQLLQ